MLFFGSDVSALLRKHSFSFCKSEIFKSQRLAGFGVKNETKPVFPGSVLQGDFEGLELIEASGVADNASAEQLALGVFLMDFHSAGSILSVCNAEFQKRVRRHITDFREGQMGAVLDAAQLKAVCVFFFDDTVGSVKKPFTFDGLPCRVVFHVASY